MKTITREGVGIGWRPENPDPNDYIYSDRRKMKRTAALVRRTRNYIHCQKKRRNQQAEGSCNGHAWAAAAHIITREDGDHYNTIYAPRWAYNMARVVEDERDHNDAWKYDNGSYIRDGGLALRKYGICPESSWRYKTGDTEAEVLKIKQFAKLPTNTQKKAALRMRLEINACMDLDMLLNAMAAGHPCPLGFSCHTGMWTREVDRTGVIPAAKAGDQQDGGHAICGIDYDMDFKHPSWARDWVGGVLCEGSWSEDYSPENPWFDNEPERLTGFHVLPFEFIKRGWADDIWAAVKEAA